MLPGFFPLALAWILSRALFACPSQPETTSALGRPRSSEAYCRSRVSPCVGGRQSKGRLSFALAADVDRNSSMPSNTPDPASELARLDEARSLLAQLLQLATQREAALAAQTEGLRVPPSASDAGEGSSLLLSSVMEDQPNFLASSSLLGPPPGTQVLEARTEERFQRLAQARKKTHTHRHRHTTHHVPSPQTHPTPSRPARRGDRTP